MAQLPDLSRFELQCLRRLWALGQASVRDLHAALENPPSYSTVRKIVERLEEKGAVERMHLDGRAWVYRPRIARSAMMRKEVHAFLDTLFDGSASGLVAHLAETDALSIDDLRELEQRLARNRPRRGRERKT